jgi:hypothetical protein
MKKSLYYIECTCIKNCKFPNVEYHIGDIIYVNPKASSDETYVYIYYSDSKEKAEICEHTKNKYNVLIYAGHLPFTRQKKFAKKWQIKSYAEDLAYKIEKRGDFKCNIKEIKMIYEEEEV